MTATSQVLTREAADAPSPETPFAAPAPELAPAAVAPVPTVEPAPTGEFPERGSSLVAGLALLLAIGWTAFFVFARRGEFAASADPRWWTAAITDWAAPVLLIGLGWLLLARGGRGRRGSDESAQLATRLAGANRDLDIARQSLAGQAKDLDALGRQAAERLSETAARLQELIQTNGERVDTIGSVSVAALENMERLRDQLPGIVNSARETTNYIGSAGRTAQGHIEELHKGLQLLGDAGVASEQQVRTLRASVDAATAEFALRCEQLDTMVTARFNALAESGDAFRARLDAHEAEALARWREAIARLDSDSTSALVLLDNAERDAASAARERLRALSDEVELIDGHFEQRGQTFAEETARRRAAAEAEQEQVLSMLSHRFAALDAEIVAARAGHEQQAAALVRHGETITAWLAQSEQRVAEIAAHGADAGSRLTGNVEALTGALAESRSELSGAETRIAALTEASSRLLELVTATVARSRDDLPAALAASQQGLAGLAEHATQLVSAIGDASIQGERMTDLLEGSGEALVARFVEVQQLQSSADQRAAGHAARLDELRDALTDIEQRNERLVGEAHGALASAVSELGGAAAAVLAEVAAAGPATVSALSQQLAEESSAGLQRVLRASVAETAGHLEQAASHAAGISREAASELREEIARVDELAVNLEARVAIARREAEDQTGHEFAQRAAVISESLKSNAIDIAGALATDVADTAWAAYLRGDRGIFARRAVSLLGPRENRSIVGLYEADPAFRGHVSRYVHDFEAMLRQLLSARDGHVLAVTLLSSDMGKLYVALAQAIERLRR